jgi:hypothetical protein
MVEFNFQTVGFVLAGISLGGIGMIMAGSFLFTEQSEQYKRQIPVVLAGLVLIGVSGVLVGAFGG